MSKLTVENLVKLLTDDAVIEALQKALIPRFEAAMEKTFGARLATAETSIIALRDENTLLRERAFAAESRIDELESKANIDTLIFKGVPEGSYAEAASDVGGQEGRGSSGTPVTAETNAHTELTIIKFCSERLNVVIDPRDISTAYRTKGSTKDSFRPIVIRFSNLRVRDAIYRAKKLLKKGKSSANNDLQTPVFVSEVLTRDVQHIFFEARQLLRQRKLNSVWTQHCKVFVKYQENDKPTYVRRAVDL